MTETAPPRKPRVFISYSHDSEEHRSRVLELSERLRSEGVDAWVDRYVTAPPEGWPKWMEDEVQRADYLLLICTETYKLRWEGRESPGKGLGVTWEAILARQLLYETGARNEKLIPVLFDGPVEACVPLALRPYTRHRLPGEYENLYRHVTNQPDVVPHAIGATRSPVPATTAAPLPTQPVLSAGMVEAELQKLFDEGMDFDARVRQTGNPEIALHAAERFRDIAGLLDHLLRDAPDGAPDDALVNTRRAQRDYFLAQEQRGLCWFHYEKRQLDDAEAAAGRSAAYIEKALEFVNRARAQAPERPDLIQKAASWPIQRLFMEIMQAAIRARRAWESGDTVTAMDHHSRCATLCAEAVRYAEQNKLDPTFSRILIGNAYGMQANGAQSAARVFEERALEGDEQSALRCMRLQIEAYRLFDQALHANPEWRPPEESMRAIQRNLRRFFDANRTRWANLFPAFQDAPEALTIMRELDPERFAQLEEPRGEVLQRSGAIAHSASATRPPPRNPFEVAIPAMDGSPPTHPRRDTGLGALDAFAILLGAASLALFLLWLATALNGNPLTADVPQVLRDIVASFWSWLAAGGVSVLLWSLSRRVSGTAYILWTVGVTIAFLVVTVALSAVLAERRGSRSPPTVEKTVQFEASGSRVAVGCEDSRSSKVEYEVPKDAYEVQRACDWVDTDDLKSQSCDTALSGTTVTATGSIRGRDKQLLNCPGGGHGTLKLKGNYRMKQPQ